MNSIYGALVALVIALITTPPLLRWARSASDVQVAAITAGEAQRITTAAQGYVNTNTTYLLGKASTTTAWPVDVGTLISGGFLPAGTLGTNPYGQTWKVLVLQQPLGTLQAIVEATGGQPPPDIVLSKIVQQMGTYGGFYPQNTSNIYTAGLIYGAGGGWTMPVGNWGVTPGSLVEYVDLTATDSSWNLLYRNAIPGAPQLNTMNTPLIMAATATVGAGPCTTGAIAQDGTGALVSCQANVWTAVGNGHWRPPVASYAALTALTASGNVVGDVRLTEDTNRAFAWTGGAWAALAVDQAGNLSVPAQLTVGGNANVTGTLSASNGKFSVDSAGNAGVAGALSVASNATVTGALSASNGDFAVNENSWGIQPRFSNGGWSMVTSIGGSLNYYDPHDAQGSIHVNDIVLRATNTWISDAVNNVNYLMSAKFQDQINSLSSQISTANSNIANIQGKLNQIGTPGVPEDCGGNQASSPIMCSPDPDSNFSWVPAQSHPQLVTVAATVGMYHTGGANGTNLCDGTNWPGDTNAVTLQASSGGVVLASQSGAGEPPNYRTFVLWPMSITFVVPAGQAASIYLYGGPNGLGCGTFSYALFGL
jgi:hypothetical protein